MAVLATLSAGAAAYGILTIPDTTVPLPQSSSIHLLFSHSHLARAPIDVNVFLEQSSTLQPLEGNAATMTIYLASPDFTQRGWSIQLIMPTGVHVVDAGDMVSRLTQNTAPYKFAEVNLTPRSDQNGAYQVVLGWNDPSRAPMQAGGAVTVATFPGVAIENEPTVGKSITNVPMPKVTIERNLGLSADYGYLSGPPPDSGSAWTWTKTSHVGFPGFGGFPDGFTVEARSVTADERSHNAEFDSGIALGIAAAALIASIQEFMNSARRKDVQVERS